MEVVKKYCSGKKHREAGRYSQLCQPSTKVRCIPKAKKSPNCWLLEELEGWEQFMFPTFFTPSCFHLLLVSIRNLDGCSAFNNNIWLQLYFEYHPRKTSSCHVGRVPTTLNPIQVSDKPVHLLSRTSWTHLCPQPRTSLGDYKDICSGAYRCACSQEQVISKVFVVQGWAKSHLNWPQRSLNS